MSADNIIGMGRRRCRNVGPIWVHGCNGLVSNDPLVLLATKKERRVSVNLSRAIQDLFSHLPVPPQTGSAS